MAATADSASLATRTVIGAGWVIAWRMSTRLLGIVSTIVLVRLLPPADFGLVALAASFSQAVEGLSGIGVNEALIRERTVNRALYDTGFTLNLLRGSVMAIVIVAEALPVAAFFHDGRLFYILLALAATTFAGSIENIGIVDFRRALTFDKEFQLSVIPRVSAIVASIGFALLHPNFWALVVGICTNRIMRMGLTYWMHPYRPRLSLSAWRMIFSFSFWTWLSGLVVLVRDRADTVFIGRIFGPTSVGIYSVGYEIGSLTSTELVEPLTAALFAGFSEAGRTGRNIAENFFKAISVTFLATLPMGAGLALLAEPAIQLTFGPRWMAAAPLVQVFALVCMLKVIAYFSFVLLNAQGLIRVSFRIVAASALARVVLLAVLLVPYGLMGAAMAATGCFVVEEIGCLIYTFRQFHLRAIDLVRGNWRCAVATMTMVAALVLEGIGTVSTDETSAALLSDLAQGFLSGVAVYVSTLVLLWWMSGRPRSAETVFFELVINLVGRLRRRRGMSTSSTLPPVGE
jgi:O-antigen/teichoic acid export membrane protein